MNNLMRPQVQPVVGRSGNRYIAAGILDLNGCIWRDSLILLYIVVMRFSHQGPEIITVIGELIAQRSPHMRSVRAPSTKNEKQDQEAKAAHGSPARIRIVSIDEILEEQNELDADQQHRPPL